MKLAVLYSGGKDSNYALYLARKYGHKIVCLITIISENKESYMFQTPASNQTKKQAKQIGIPLMIIKTLGVKEEELLDLKRAIKEAIKKYEIEGIVTGAVRSVYQASRIKNICTELGIECINPIWQKNQLDLLKELVEKKFEVIIVGVGAYPLDETWIGRKIDKKFIQEMQELQNKYQINPSGEGGEYESFVLYSPLFKKRLRVKHKEITGSGNAWRMEIEVEEVK